VKRVRKYVSLALAFMLLALPTIVNGEETSKTDVNKSMSSRLNLGKMPKKQNLIHKTNDFKSPSDYPIKNDGQDIATLVDNYGSNHYITFENVSNNTTDQMDVQLLYKSDYSFYKESNVDIEFYSEQSGALQYLGYTQFDTYGKNNVLLHSHINKSDYTNQKYIYVRLGISAGDTEYYSDATLFKVLNPFYTAPDGNDPSTPDSTGDYVIISNESVDGENTQSTGNNLLHNNQYTFNKSLKKSAYQMDVNKPFTLKPDKKKVYNKRFAIQGLTYQVGAKKDFWVSNLVNNENTQINAELLYSGTKANVWVYNHYISSQDAGKLGQEFDANIYPSVTSNFGKESDVNGDSKINILCYDIQDGFSGSGGYVAGYFYPGDLYDSSYSPGSNESEIFYVDTYPSMGIGANKDVTTVYETLAHEFQHMVNYNENVLMEGHGDMDVWMNEGLSMAAEQIYTGHALVDRIDYYNQSDSIANGHSLLYWDDSGDVLANYSLSYLLFQYLKIQAGQGDKIFKEILTDPKNNYVAIENIIKKYIDPKLTFGQFMTDFREALLLKSPTGLFGFKGDPSFNALEPRLYTGSSTYLRGGGAIVEQTNDGMVTPSVKGDNISYTFVNKDGSSVDNIPPAKPTVTAVSDRDTVVRGKTEANSSIYVMNGSKLIGSQTKNNSENFTVAIPKQKAGTKLTVYVEDAAKNKSGIVSVTVLDKTAPARPSINTVGDNQLVVSGKAEASSKVTIKVGRILVGQATSDRFGKYTAKLKAKLKAGTVLTVYAADQAGNQSSGATMKVLDKTAPRSPSVNKLTHKSKAVYGKAERGSTVYLYKGSKYINKAKVDSKSDYKMRMSPQKKGSTISLYVKDQAGNKSRRSSVKVK
jgi:large repetitive protein